MNSSDVCAASILFYPETHEYFTPPGREGGLRIPNVTTVLRAVGVSADFQNVEPGTLEFRRQLGTAVHTDCHAYDDQDLAWATVDERVKRYVLAWGEFRDANQLTPTTRERLVYSRTFNYCGTLDGIFLLTDGSRVLIDIKTGDPEDAAAHLQTAAYEFAYREEHPEAPIAARWSVHLTPELKVPYRIHPYTDFRDFGKFQACLTVFHEQPARRRRIR
jgi:hypothetical protein